MSVVPPVHRSFQQQPFAQFDALQSAEPLLLAELLELPLAAPLELLLPLPLELLVTFVVPDDDDDAAEFSEPPLPDPPEPPEPEPLLEMVWKSSPVAQATNAIESAEIQIDFFIWAPWGLRPC